MATFTRLPSGRWRVQIRRKQSYASETFLRHDDARQWATATERRIDLGDAPVKRAKVDPTTFEYLIDLHIDDMCEVGTGKASPRATPTAARWPSVKANRGC